MCPVFDKDDARRHELQKAQSREFAGGQMFDVTSMRFP